MDAVLQVNDKLFSSPKDGKFHGNLRANRTFHPSKKRKFFSPAKPAFVLQGRRGLSLFERLAEGVRPASIFVDIGDCRGVYSMLYASLMPVVGLF
jgi:hypothetical protein